LVVFGINACRGRVEYASGVTAPACLKHIEVYERRIVHDVRIVFTGENKSGPAHVGSQLVNLVKTAVNSFAA
jgi:hypothetical protein